MIRQVPDVDLPTVMVGATALAALLAMRRIVPRWPRALLVMVVSIVFVGYSETLASARAMATRHGYEIDPDQELIAEGVACAAAGFVGSFATDGSLSKSSVADSAGQRSQMASIVNAAFVLLTMVALAGLVTNLATAVLGAVVIDAMVGLVTLRDFRRYRQVNQADWVFFLSLGLGIIFFSITAGIAIGVVLSLLRLIARSSRPENVRIGRDQRTGSYLEVAGHPDVEIDPDALVVRLRGPLFFANANRFHDAVRSLLLDLEPRPVVVVADMEAVSMTDTDGADILATLAGSCATTVSTSPLPASRTRSRTCGRVQVPWQRSSPSGCSTKSIPRSPQVEMSLRLRSPLAETLVSMAGPRQVTPRRDPCDGGLLVVAPDQEKDQPGTHQPPAEGAAERL